MPDRRLLYPPFDDDDEDEWLAEQLRLHERESTQTSPRAFDRDLPGCRPDTGDVIYPCPSCKSSRTERRHIARRIGGAIGATAGCTSAAAAALSGAEMGAAAGTLGGPFGVLCGSIAGAIIAGLAGAAAGCATGAALGETIDRKVLDNWRCCACGHTFSTGSD
ncbi:UNVERIFIED_ORG: ribosomal protein L37AE/L43A [Paraburkholderia sediminicola]|nr:ribosomal protein L37AE/L43A [Paraburkholderia sediminicola]